MHVIHEGSQDTHAPVASLKVYASKHGSTHYPSKSGLGGNFSNPSAQCLQSVIKGPTQNKHESYKQSLH